MWVTLYRNYYCEVSRSRHCRELVNLASSLNSVPEELHEDDGPVDEVHLLLEQDEVVYLGLVRPLGVIGVT